MQAHERGGVPFHVKVLLSVAQCCSPPTPPSKKKNNKYTNRTKTMLLTQIWRLGCQAFLGLNVAGPCLG